MNTDTERCLKKLGELRKGDSVWLSHNCDLRNGYRPGMLITKVNILDISPYKISQTVTVIYLDHPLIRKFFIDNCFMCEHKLYESFRDVTLYTTPVKELKDWFRLKKHELFDPLYSKYDETEDDKLRKEIIETEQEWEEYEQDLW